MKFALVKLGNIEGQVTDFLASTLEEHFGDPPQLVEVPPPQGAWNADREQFDASLLLKELKDVPGERTLGLIDKDIFDGDFNFIFGMADEDTHHSAVVSIWRLRADSPDLFLDRVWKECLHELGHTFELDHCDTPRCLMRFSNTLAEVDEKSVALCPRCSSLGKLPTQK